MVLLSRKSLLAVAAVIDVAVHGQEHPVSAKALAARHSLPARHLEPVLQALVRMGILKGIRGPRGGYELARERKRITADEILRAAGIESEISGREKTPYSIWRKLQRKSVGFSSLSDIYGFRVIVEAEDDCYRALGVIHRKWRTVPGRFKDYISQPKSNGYRSIHSTVSARDGTRVEVQIRTRAMHEVAEAGVAAG